MSAPLRVAVAAPALPVKQRNVLIPVLATAGGALVLGSIVGVVIDRVTDPQMQITPSTAEQRVEDVLRDDYGLADATSTTCQEPIAQSGATFTCTAKTGAVESGQVTVTVTVLNDAAQLSVGAPE